MVLSFAGGAGSALRWLLRYDGWTHTFVPFAWYRIAFGIVVLRGVACSCMVKSAN